MPLTLRTAEVPVPDRVDFWREAMSRVLNATCVIEPGRGAPFDASIAVMPFEGIELIEMRGSPYTSTRLGPGRSGWVSIMLQVEGAGVVREGGRATRLAPGDLCLIPHDREMVAARPARFRQVLVDVPTSTMNGMAPRWREVAARPLPSSSPSGRAAADLVRLLVDHQPMLEAVGRTCIAETAIGLLARVVEDAAGGAATADGALAGTRLATFHRRRIDDIVRARLREPDLSVEAIARETRLSPRYVHKLFQAERTSVMRRVTELRLDACLADLRARDGRTIGAIAYAWGFNSTAHFCRAFRKRFGMRPSDA